MKEDAAELLHRMKLIREFEIEIYKQIDEGMVRGTTHVSIGQEAVAVGACSAKKNGDIVTSTHRGHGHFIASGGDVNKIMAELFGREDGYCSGKGGTQHMAGPECGFVGSNGITGGGIPYATGMAMGMKKQNKRNAVICFFGDGAVNQGTFHESLNMASIWKLPVIYIIENNMYAMGTKFTHTNNIKYLSERGRAYGIPGYTVDGNDLLKVRETVDSALQRAYQGEGPTLIEAVTYRVAGHSRNDRCSYRTREEENSWKEKCPISQFSSTSKANGWLNDESIESIDNKVKSSVQEAVHFATKSGYLSAKEIVSGVYC